MSIGGLGSSLAVLSGAVMPSQSAAAQQPSSPAGPPTVTPADLRFRPRTLRPGGYREAGLDPRYAAQMVPAAEEYLRPGPGRPDPSEPGFVFLAARDGVVVEHAARGHAVRYERWDEKTEQAVELPEDRWVPMAEDTIFDMASISKLFTSVVLVRLAEAGTVDVTAPVVEYLPAFASRDPDKAPITVEQLVTHTSGQKPFINLKAYPDNAARMEAVYAEPLVFAPGTDYTYSDLNLITVGRLMEDVTGKTLDVLVAELITLPLGLHDTGYNPPADKLHRVAATEWQGPETTGRGMVRGTVHDENAWYLGGVAGHAGIFSTARDMAVFGQTMLNGGLYGEERLLGEQWVRDMITNRNAALGPSAARGLGWELGKQYYMEGLASPVSFGHTGYTGTSLTCDPLTGTLAVMLTNRVHPTRGRGTTSNYRQAPVRKLARAALPVRPAIGRHAWFAGQRDASDATLTVPLEAPVEDGSLRFRVWFDTEPEFDGCAVEATADGTEWTAVPLTLSGRGAEWSVEGTLTGWGGRRWLRAEGDLPRGTTSVRWHYTSDRSAEGRGVYVDDMRVLDGVRPVFLGVRPSDEARIEAVGWSAESD